MSQMLPSQDVSVFARRQRRLRDALAGTPALLLAGGWRPRNYPANVYPFRADSHFLYLVGASIPDAALLLTAANTELFMRPTPPDDALWHGATTPTAALVAATGIDRIRPLAELDAAISLAGGPDAVGSLPPADPSARRSVGRTLGRAWADSLGAATLEGADAQVADAIIACRLIHDEGALQQLRHAAEGTTAAHLAGMAITRPGLHERDVRAAMEAELMRRDQSTSYGSIVTVHGEVLHNNDYSHPLAAGDLLLVDVGAEHQGWAGDVTRTWPVNGSFSATQRALYDIVLQAELDAIAMVRPGVRYRDIHLRAARTLTRGLVDEGILRGDVDSLVERGAHALFFPHGVGHLLGLDAHDMEGLGDRAGYAPGRSRSAQFGLGYLRLDRDLEAGMAVTIEPGLYFVPAILTNDELCGPFDADGTLNRDALSRFADVRGIRIEDDILCTTDAPENLTAKIPKRASAVEEAVRGA